MAWRVDDGESFRQFLSIDNQYIGHDGAQMIIGQQRDASTSGTRMYQDESLPALWMLQIFFFDGMADHLRLRRPLELGQAATVIWVGVGDDDASNGM